MKSAVDIKFSLFEIVQINPNIKKKFIKYKLFEVTATKILINSRLDFFDIGGDF